MQETFVDCLDYGVIKYAEGNLNFCQENWVLVFGSTSQFLQIFPFV